MRILLKPVPRIKYGRAALGLCLAAGIFYNSWPLGYWLDRQTAQHGLASELEVVGHPYYWLFILGDVLTAACMIAVAVILRFRLWPLLRSKAWAAVTVGLLVFGLFTGVSAFLPSQCTITPVLRCGAGHGQGLGLDAVTSSLAALGLLISLVCLSLRTASLVRLTRAITIAWSASGLVFVVFALTNSGAAYLAQNIFLILYGLALLVIGLNISRNNIDLKGEDFLG
jgi:hypothetical protein